MAQYSVDAGDLNNYVSKMILYAIKYHKENVVHLLQSNGIQVPENVDDTTLHAMVLKAMVSSTSFKEGLIELLHSIAMEGKTRNLKNYANANGTWANQTGTDTTDTSSVCLNNDTLNGLFTTGINATIAALTKGNTNTNIKNKVTSCVADTTTPPPASNTFRTVAITLGVVGLTVATIWYILLKKHKK